jgi:hypothetical protein
MGRPDWRSISSAGLVSSPLAKIGASFACGSGISSVGLSCRIAASTIASLARCSESFRSNGAILRRIVCRLRHSLATGLSGMPDMVGNQPQVGAHVVVAVATQYREEEGLRAVIVAGVTAEMAPPAKPRRQLDRQSDGLGGTSLIGQDN